MPHQEARLIALPHLESSRVVARVAVAGILIVIGGALPIAGQRPPTARRPLATPLPATLLPGEWPSAGRDPGLTRFSPLDQITSATVVSLKPVWTFSTGQLRGHQGTPLVVGSVMFVHSPFPNAVFALDLSRAAVPVMWRYAIPSTPIPVAPPTGCCDVGSRGLAYHPSGKVLVPLLSGDLAALDAKTGREIWRVHNADGKNGATMPGAPLIAKDLVIVGTAGSDYGIRGTLTAYDANTGRLVWRAYHTGPDSDVLIDGPVNSQFASYRGRDFGVSSWPADAWKRGGATASGWLSYDPDNDLLFYGTDRPASYLAAGRTGDNRWSSTIFARSATTGRVRWAYQITPHDQWGYDGSNESIVADLSIAGKPVQALVHFDRNGFAYTFDRLTGQLLIAEGFGPANWAIRIDLNEGHPVVDSRYAQGSSKTTGICPAALGAKGYEPAAYSPLTGLFFVPTTNLCMELTPGAAVFAPGQPFLGATIKTTFGPGLNHGRFIAWNGATGTAAWQIQEPYPVTGGALATGGGVVFYGTMDGWLKAVNQASGLELWKFKMPSGIVGSPMTYLGPDGKQYLAVLSGFGGWLGLGGNGAYPDLSRITNQGGTLFVFGL